MSLPRRHRFRLSSAGALACALCAASSLPAQETPLIAQDVQAQQQQQQPAPPNERPGLLNELGKLLKSPADLLPSLPKSEPVPVEPAAPPPAAAAPPPLPARQPPPASAAAPPPAPAAPVAPEPAPASSRLFPGMANGREPCPASSGGGPDCQAATDKLCQSKGYKSGKSLSTDSAYACSARLARAEGGKACGTEYYVTSAFCQ